jgi:hypothetical protein
MLRQITKGDIMLRFLIGLFIILHGLVHLWYFTLSQRLVVFKPEMGWTGKSWILSSLLGDSTTRLLAGALFVLVAIVFVISGVGLFVGAEWWRTALISSAIFSCAIILIFWDGSMQLIIQKGLIGFLISLVMLLVLLLPKGPSAIF